MKKNRIIVLAFAAWTAAASAQQLPAADGRAEAATQRGGDVARPDGTLVLLRAEAETFVDNDEARVSLFVQEQNADRAAAASAVNRRMRDAIARAKESDPTAELRSTGYHTYPEYAPRSNKIVGWQVRQEVLVVTRKLDTLEKLVAQAQATAGVAGVQFGLSREAQRKVDAQLFDMAFADMRERMSNVARALGKTEQDVVIEEVDLSSVDRPIGIRPQPMMARAELSADVAPPKFEPGDTRQALSFTARVRVRR